MQRTFFLLCVLFVCHTNMQAQTPSQKPDPELRKLSIELGHWTFEGEYKPGPLAGLAGKFKGEFNGEMILGDFFFQARWTEKRPEGETQALEIDAYDPVNKNFVSNWYLSDGSRFSGVLTFAANTYTYAGKLITAEKQYQFKGTFALASDQASGTFKSEISADGKAWTPFSEERWTKVKSLPKK